MEKPYIYNGNKIDNDIRSLIETVIITNKVKHIPKEAFADAVNLKNIIIPESVLTIGKEAFSYCLSLEEIIIPNSVGFIDEFAFELCKNLKNIKLPENIMIINEGTFQYCPALMYIRIPATVQYISYGSFEDCESLSVIIFDAFFVSDEDDFGNRKVLVRLANEMLLDEQGIEEDAFSGCESLKTIVIDCVDNKYKYKFEKLDDQIQITSFEDKNLQFLHIANKELIRRIFNIEDSVPFKNISHELYSISHERVSPYFRPVDNHTYLPSLPTRLRPPRTTIDRIPPEILKKVFFDYGKSKRRRSKSKKKSKSKKVIRKSKKVIRKSKRRRSK
jgi:hypothetical protein